jgi:hypothetical protein
LQIKFKLIQPFFDEASTYSGLDFAFANVALSNSFDCLRFALLFLMALIEPTGSAAEGAHAQSKRIDFLR